MKLCPRPIGARLPDTSTFVHLTRRASPGSSSAETAHSSRIAKGSNRLPNRGPSAPTNSTGSHGAGACDFPAPADDADARPVLWTPAALPSVIALARLPADLPDPRFRILPPLGAVLAETGPERLIELDGSLHRLHLIEDLGDTTACVLLPLDRLFDLRAAAALQLWRALTGRASGRDPAILPAPRRDRLVLALRALDARLDKASYREITAALFGAARVPKSGWKTHDLRDRTVRLARLGLATMQGGYRRLLLYPFRGRISNNI